MTQHLRPTHLIGHTPIVEFDSGHAHIRLLAKCEFTNPTGSIKDRVAQYIIDYHQQHHGLTPDTLLVEASSGNMGASLAFMAQQYGYRIHIVCPDKTGSTKRHTMQALGAQLTICPNTTDTDSPSFYVNKARQIAREQHGFYINQYDSTLNAQCHFETTGQEMVDYCHQHDIMPDYFITCGGSGGTITGCSRHLKQAFPHLKTIMPDPIGSIYYDLFYQKRIIPENVKAYQVEGPGNPRLCNAMDLSSIDQVMQFVDTDALAAMNQLATEQGILGGHSAAANYLIAKRLIKSLSENKQPTTILTLIPDTGMKYYCTTAVQQPSSTAVAKAHEKVPKCAL